MPWCSRQNSGGKEGEEDDHLEGNPQPHAHNPASQSQKNFTTVLQSFLVMAESITVLFKSLKCEITLYLTLSFIFTKTLVTLLQHPASAEFQAFIMILYNCNNYLRFSKHEANGFLHVECIL